MKKSLTYSRKIRVPVDDRGFNANEYFLSLTVEFNEEDLDKFTIIEKQEFKELAEEIDKIQREIVKDETGITELPMDVCKQRNRIKRKLITKSVFKRK